MLRESLLEVYDKFKFEFYRVIFSLVKEREGSLSAMEAFSLEVIHGLGEPTVGQFAEFLNISQSNATYKVNSLTRKGYIIRENSEADRREYRLVLSEKYYGYISLMRNYIYTVADRVEARFSPQDAEKFDSLLQVISRELMPESDGRPEG